MAKNDAQQLAKRHHALAMPICGQGHLNPLMRLCKALARHHAFTITFVDIEPVHRRIQQLGAAAAATAQQQKREEADALIVQGEDDEEAALDIRRVHIPIDGLDLRDDFRLSLETFMAAQQNSAPHIQHLIRQLNQQYPPVTCLICDFGLVGPAQQVASTFSIPWITLYTCNATTTLLCDYVASSTPAAGDAAGPAVDHDPRLSLEAVLEALSGKRETSMDSVFSEGLPGLPTITVRDLLNFKHVVDNNVYTWQYLLHGLRQCKASARALLFNTSEALEGPALQILSQRWNGQLPIYAVGPLVEALQQKSSTSLWKEDEECMRWLDKQPPLSVLYISFGSFTLLSESQLEEVISGLLASQQRFLWAFRPDLVAGGSSSIPCAGHVQLSQAHAAGRGCVVHWAPQLRVLSHPSVGGFLTHCGWNSVTEAISQGVPMLCWPYFADQFLDARQVADVWKVGLYFESIRKGRQLVPSSEVESMILRLMEGDDGPQLRHNVQLLKEACHQGLKLPNGTSHASIQHFIESLEHPHLECMSGM